MINEGTSIYFIRDLSNSHTDTCDICSKPMGVSESKYKDGMIVCDTCYQLLIKNESKAND